MSFRYPSQITSSFTAQCLLGLHFHFPHLSAIWGHKTSFSFKKLEQGLDIFCLQHMVIHLNVFPLASQKLPHMLVNTGVRHVGGTKYFMSILTPSAKLFIMMSCYWMILVYMYEIFKFCTDGHKKTTVVRLSIK